jgi:hypothetical protein
VLLHDPLLEVGTTVSGWTHRHIAAEIRAGRLRDVGGTRSEERPMLLDELLDLAPPAATLRLEINGSGARDRGVRLRSVGAAVRAYSPRTSGEHASMSAAATTPLQSKFGPIVADAAGTITVQEASDVLDYSRLRVCQLLDASAGRVLVTDVLALKSSVPPTTLKPAPAAKLVR